jgi:HSP20 family protein
MAATAGMRAPWVDPFRLAMYDPFRMVQDVLRDPFSGRGQLDRWFGDFSPSAFQPSIDVEEESDALRITAELPGLTREDVQIQVEDDALVLRGEKKLESKSEDKGCFRIERAFGSFERVIPLPDGIDTSRAEAKFENGVLTIRIPKAPTQKPAAGRLKIN